MINFTVTVPVGCFNESLRSHCKASIFILTPTYQSSVSSCQNFSNQGEISFDENNCGILIESSTWWEEKVLKVTGKTDGLINVKDRDVFIRLGTRTTKNAADGSGVWNNFTMPDIRVCTLAISFSCNTIYNSSRTRYLTIGQLMLMPTCMTDDWHVFINFSPEFRIWYDFLWKSCRSE